jgi:hypothetical protein
MVIHLREILLDDSYMLKVLKMEINLLAFFNKFISREYQIRLLFQIELINCDTADNVNDV